MDDSKFKDKKDLIESIDMGLDIEMDLLGIRYCIGKQKNQVFISWDNGDHCFWYLNGTKLVNQFKVHDLPLGEYIQDIFIDTM